ncbi:hypothetical protein D0Y65_031434 [Glycine soja]|uniref:Uncharacterized protein n=1 Tax=Glycine soja TaxID=3848 RepID=A0A445I8A6_GLYSO|nr:hypothetical protein D0Y65_031434 [Glycine soja]RZB82250.1 hypothetical protein D0Y65_031434 [Glycine soja]RZB82251.1 hypothetical protein D0Y65_031434 [Glycine soja]
MLLSFGLGFKVHLRSKHDHLENSTILEITQQRFRISSHLPFLVFCSINGTPDLDTFRKTRSNNVQRGGEAEALRPTQSFAFERAFLFFLSAIEKKSYNMGGF